MASRRFARGSTTGQHQIDADAVRCMTAHVKVQEAARAVVGALDDASLSGVGGIEITADDDSMLLAIEKAQRFMRPRA